MTENKAELLFPPRLIHSLKSLRESSWKDLVERVINLEPLEIERLAFILMMVHLAGCTNCQADSYKAMRGCAQCSFLTIKRFRENDSELLYRYSESVMDIQKFFNEEW